MVLFCQILKFMTQSIFHQLSIPNYKSGIITLVKYLAKYSKNLNINVNCISPGGIKDSSQGRIFKRKYKNLSLNKGLLDPTDITDTVLFLLSDSSKYINGQNIVIDDGRSL